MKSERIQFNMLAEQNIQNVFRKVYLLPLYILLLITFCYYYY